MKTTKLEAFVKGIQSDAINPDVITVAHRSNNKKRDFLFVNKWQGKHIPANPVCTEFMLYQLVELCKKKIPMDKKVLVVGFAETATLIGSQIADNLPNCVYYVQTTHTKMIDLKSQIDFKEEHSHIKQQYLYWDDSSIPMFDYVLFVDDEATTGKTVLNCIDQFNKKFNGLSYGICTICNWILPKDKYDFKYNKLIDLIYLIGGHLTDDEHRESPAFVESKNEWAVDIAESDSDIQKAICDASEAFNKTGNNPLNITSVNTGIDPFTVERYGRRPRLASRAAAEVEVANYLYWNKLEAPFAEKVLVLGVEEFMEFPFRVASRLCNLGVDVHFHATTRSPIDIQVVDGDIHENIVNKNMLHSAYDSRITSYIYNLDKYDKIFILMNQQPNPEFIMDITSALMLKGNKLKDIIFVPAEE